MFPLPGPGRWDREDRDRTPLPKRRVALSVRSRWALLPARLPPNPQAEVPQSPGQLGRRTETENGRPTLAGQFQLGFLRPGSPSPSGARREKRMEEVQWLLRGRSLTPTSGADPYHSSWHTRSSPLKLSCGSVPLTITRFVNLLNFRHRGRIHSSLIIVCTACCRSTWGDSVWGDPIWGDGPSHWRLDAGLCAV